MLLHMRTTMIITDQLMRELKKKAAEQKRTLSEVTEEALRRGLAELGAKFRECCVVGHNSSCKAASGYFSHSSVAVR